MAIKIQYKMNVKIEFIFSFLQNKKNQKQKKKQTRLDDYDKNRVPK